MERYHCETCNMLIKPKSKSKHFILNLLKTLDKGKHIKLTIYNPNMDDIDKAFYAYLNK